MVTTDAEWDGMDRRQSDRKWRLDRAIPLPFIAALVLQSFGLVWYFSASSTRLEMKMDNTAEQLKELKIDRYSKEDARRDQQLLMQMVTGLKDQDQDVERRVTAIENRHNEVERGRAIGTYIPTPRR
jgi:hypothetical protein